jgi:transcriptional regulator GlxA family with amidase domain
VPVPTAFLSGLDALLRRAGIARPAPRFPVAGPSPDASTPATDDLVVGQVQDFVDDHLAADLTLDRLAEAAGVSPSSLGRRFREEMDTTPWRYVLRRRVEKAKELLRETDRSLAAIALDTGFYDQPHFTRTFKRFEGQTPGDYREATT